MLFPTSREDFFFDLILINIYKILKVTSSDLFYRNKNDVKTHALVIFSGLQSINIFNLIGILYFLAFLKVQPLVLMFTAFILPLIFNYVIYYKNKRFDKIINSELINNKIIHYVLTLMYTIITFCLMNIVSNYIRGAGITRKY